MDPSILDLILPEMSALGSKKMNLMRNIQDNNQRKK
jgi:hypothetical protein